MRHLLGDARHALRVMASRPVLTATTVLTLALGIGGATAMFSIASALLVRPLPVPAPDRLVRVFGTTEARTLGIASYPNLHDIGERAGSFSAFTIHQQAFAAYGLGEETISAAAELVSGTYFATFGVAPRVGRAITPADDTYGAARAVAVVSDGWWRSHLGADPAALGRIVYLNGAPFEVIGVAPPSFRGSYDAAPTDLWVPLMTYGTVRPRGLDVRRRSWGWLQATARLAPAATVASAAAEVRVLGDALVAAFPAENRDLRVTVVPASAAPEAMTPLLTRVLAFALLVTALALLAACANVANAQLATVTDRGAEIAVRMAMGATRRDVARLWIVESVVTTVAAGAVGLLAAAWLRDGFLALQPLTGRANFAPAVDLDWRVGVWAAVVVALTALVSGVLPALRAAAVDPARSIQEGAATTTTAPRGRWLARGLVSSQAAVSILLVALAALLGRSVAASTWFDVGFATEGLVVATANTSGLGLDAVRSQAYHDDTMRRVRALPGVAAVTAAAVVPLGGNDEQRGVAIDGYTPPSGDAFVSIATNVVWPGYFEMMDIPMVRGRAFAAADGRPDAPLAVVVNQTMARTYWPDADAIGRRLRFGETPAEVVGVARDITYYALGEEPMPYLYVPFGPVPFPDGLTFHVRTAAPGVAVERLLAAELRRLDPRVRVVDAMPYQDLRAQALFPTRAMGALSGGFGVLALLLFLAGTYGVTAHAVTARRRELALRVALGAAPGELRGAVVRQAIGWGVPGVAAGIAATVAVAQLLRAFLFGVTTADPWAIGAAVLAVVATAALAAYVPARVVVGADLVAQLRR
ncbi:MAG: ADOP family duplicated permease [Vicinamibacterales bacterium]